MTSKRPKKKPRGASSAEHRFQIDAFTPETMPMARLAEYIAQLAAVLGETTEVHLVALEPGSTVLVQQIETAAIPKVLDRTDAVRRGEAPRDAIQAYRRINMMLREDNGRALFRRGKKGRKILEFPGRDEAAERYPGVKQAGSLQGVLVRVGGVGDSIPVLLEAEDRQQAGCHANRHLAKELARALFEPIRVTGMGYWERDAEGEWGLKHFRIDTYEILSDQPLSSSIRELRAMEFKWAEDALEDVLATRNGWDEDGSG